MDPLGDLLDTPGAALAANRPQEAPKINQAAARKAHGVQFSTILVPSWYHFGTILEPYWTHFGTALGIQKPPNNNINLDMFSDTVLGSILTRFLINVGTI